MTLPPDFTAPDREIRKNDEVAHRYVGNASRALWSYSPAGLSLHEILKAEACVALFPVSRYMGRSDFLRPITPRRQKANKKRSWRTAKISKRERDRETRFTPRKNTNTLGSGHLHLRAKKRGISLSFKMWNTRVQAHTKTIGCEGACMYNFFFISVFHLKKTGRNNNACDTSKSNGARKPPQVARQRATYRHSTEHRREVSMVLPAHNNLVQPSTFACTWIL